MNFAVVSSCVSLQTLVVCVCYVFAFLGGEKPNGAFFLFLSDAGCESAASWVTRFKNSVFKGGKLCVWF